MSDLTQEKKLIWLGLKRAESDRSILHEEIEKLKENVGEYSAFESDLDDENIVDFATFRAYLEMNGFNSDESKAFEDKIEQNFTDDDSSGSTYDEFEDYVENTATSYSELKNAFATATTVGLQSNTDRGTQTAGIKFHEEQGISHDGITLPAGTVEIFGNRIEFSQTAAPTGNLTTVSYSNLTISNTTPFQGETVDVSADVSNTGSKPGTVFVPLIEDGIVTETRRLDIAANTTETVTFTVFYAEIGQIDVTIKDLTPQTITVVPEGF